MNEPEKGITEADWIDIQDGTTGSTIRTRKATQQELMARGANLPMIFIPGRGMVRTQAPSDPGEEGLPLNPAFQNYLSRDMTALAFSEEGYRRNSLVFALINIRAVALQQAPLRLYDAAKPDEPIDDCPLLELLSFPNPLFDEKKMLCHTETYRCIGGDSYWHKVRDKYGVVIGIYPYHASQITPIASATSWLSHYRYDNGAGYVLDIPREDIARFAWTSIDFSRPSRSISPLASIAAEIDVDNERKYMELALLQNGAVPAFLVEAAPTDAGRPPTQAQLDILSTRLEQKFGGKNRGKGMVVPNGVKAHVLGFSPRNMATTEFSKIPETRACSVLGVPIQVTSLYNSAVSKTYANYAEAKHSLYEDSIVPTWLLYGSAITHAFHGEVFKGDKRQYIAKFDYSDVPALQDSVDTLKSQAVDEFAGNIVTLDESRELLGYPPDQQYGGKYAWELTGGSSTDSEGPTDAQQEQAEQLMKAMESQVKLGRVKVVKSPK